MQEQISNTYDALDGKTRELGQRMLSVDDLKDYQSAYHQWLQFNAELKAAESDQGLHAEYHVKAQQDSMESRFSDMRMQLTMMTNMELESLLDTNKTGFQKIVGAVLATGDTELITDIVSTIERLKQQAIEQASKDLAAGPNESKEQELKQKIDFLSRELAQINNGIKINEFIQKSNELNTRMQAIVNNDELNLENPEIQKVNQAVIALKNECQRLAQNSSLTNEEQKKLIYTLTDVKKNHAEVRNKLIDEFDQIYNELSQEKDSKKMMELIKTSLENGDPKLADHALVMAGHFQNILKEVMSKEMDALGKKYDNEKSDLKQSYGGDTEDEEYIKKNKEMDEQHAKEDEDCYEKFGSFVAAFGELKENLTTPQTAPAPEPEQQVTQSPQTHRM